MSGNSVTDEALADTSAMGITPNRHVSRRTCIKAGGTTAAALLLVRCKPTAIDSPQPPSKTPDARPTAAVTKTAVPTKVATETSVATSEPERYPTNANNLRLLPYDSAKEVIALENLKQTGSEEVQHYMDTLTVLLVDSGIPPEAITLRVLAPTDTQDWRIVATAGGQVYLLRQQVMTETSTDPVPGLVYATMNVRSATKDVLNHTGNVVGLEAVQVQDFGSDTHQELAYDPITQSFVVVHVENTDPTHIVAWYDASKDAQKLPDGTATREGTVNKAEPYPLKESYARAMARLWAEGTLPLVVNPDVYFTKSDGTEFTLGTPPVIERRGFDPSQSNLSKSEVLNFAMVPLGAFAKEGIAYLVFGIEDAHGVRRSVILGSGYIDQSVYQGLVFIGTHVHAWWNERFTPKDRYFGAIPDAGVSQTLVNRGDTRSLWDKRGPGHEIAIIGPRRLIEANPDRTPYLTDEQRREAFFLPNDQSFSLLQEALTTGTHNGQSIPDLIDVNLFTEQLRVMREIR